MSRTLSPVTPTSSVTVNATRPLIAALGSMLGSGCNKRAPTTAAPTTVRIIKTAIPMVASRLR